MWVGSSPPIICIIYFLLLHISTAIICSNIIKHKRGNEGQAGFYMKPQNIAVIINSNRTIPVPVHRVPSFAEHTNQTTTNRVIYFYFMLLLAQDIDRTYNIVTF